MAGLFVSCLGREVKPNDVTSAGNVVTFYHASLP